MHQNNKKEEGKIRASKKKNKIKYCGKLKKIKKLPFLPLRKEQHTCIHARTHGNPINWILVWTPNASRRLNSQMAVREMLVSA